MNVTYPSTVENNPLYLEVVYKKGVDLSFPIKYEVNLTNAGPFEKSNAKIRVTILM